MCALARLYVPVAPSFVICENKSFSSACLYDIPKSLGMSFRAMRSSSTQRAKSITSLCVASHSLRLLALIISLSHWPRPYFSARYCNLARCSLANACVALCLFSFLFTLQKYELVLKLPNFKQIILFCIDVGVAYGCKLCSDLPTEPSNLRSVRVKCLSR